MNDAGSATVALVTVVVKPVEIQVCVPRKASEIPASETTPLRPDFVDGCKNGSAFVESETRSEIQPRVRRENYVVVFVGDGTTTLGAANVSSVTWSMHKERAEKGSVTAVSCAETQNAWTDRYFVLCKIYDDKFTDASHNDVVEVDASIGGTTFARFGRFTKPWSLASNVAGFWIPIGLFGTNFQSNEDGITLAALPVGLAWGIQYNLRKAHYVGLSVFGSWTIAPQKTAGSTNGNYTVAAISPGGFIDFDGYVYAGYAYAADLRDAHADPGHMMVIGMGPKLLEFLKGQQ